MVLVPEWPEFKDPDEDLQRYEPEDDFEPKKYDFNELDFNECDLKGLPTSNSQPAESMKIYDDPNCDGGSIGYWWIREIEKLLREGAISQKSEAEILEEREKLMEAAYGPAPEPKSKKI